MVFDGMRVAVTGGGRDTGHHRSQAHPAYYTAKHAQAGLTDIADVYGTYGKP
jgi:hypothetical protein